MNSILIKFINKSLPIKTIDIGSGDIKEFLFVKKLDQITGFKLEKNIKLPFKDKTIEAKCIFAYQENRDSQIHYFTGITKGTLVEPRGNMNFGWDPVFLPEGYNETYGEMDNETKNSISHRFKALQLLKEFLNIE